MGEAIAIIAEFNPFHQGHAALIEAVRQHHGNVPIVVLMSGSFVQRGQPALFDKWRRAHWAVVGGADLVIELPSAFALSGAEGFANGGVRLAAALGCSGLACGVEQGQAGDFLDLARSALSQPLREYIALARQEGRPYGTALTQALAEALPQKAHLLYAPNSLLALEYAKAILTWAPQLQLETVRRDSRHDGQDCNGSFLRRKVGESAPFAEYGTYIPPALQPDFLQALDDGAYTDYERYHDLILYEGRKQSVEELSRLAAFREGIEHRWHEAIGAAADWTRGCKGVKTRRYPYSRLNRMAAYTVLGITQAAMSTWLREGPQYGRMLALNSRGSQFLHERRKQAACTLITKITKAGGTLTPSAQAMLSLDVLATDIQYLCMHHKEQRLARQDYYRSPLVVPT